MGRSAHESIGRLADAAHALSGINYEEYALVHNRDESPLTSNDNPLRVAGRMVARAKAKFQIGYHGLRALRVASNKYDQAEIYGYLISGQGRVRGLSYSAGQLSAHVASLFERH